MVLLAAFVLISIGFSFLCSVLEAALLSLTPSYIAQLKETRPKLHDALSRLKSNIDRPLAAILTLNTIAHTVGATGVGAQVSILFGETYIAVASALMTLLILVLSEIIPKTIGATYWRGLAPLLPPVLRVMIVVLAPFLWLSELITNRIGKSEHDVDMRGEIKALARIGLEGKALDSDETRTIVNILNLHEITVKSVMTPRTVCETVTPMLTVGEFDQRYGKTQFTRFPVMDGGEQAMGYVHKADTYHADDAQTMKALMHPVDAIQEADNVEHVFTSMLRDHNHMRVVYDDHGTWVGLITLEDVIETILGQDIVDETDNVQNLRKYAKQRWLKRIKRDESARSQS
ncbi:CNNM domain-containing protein [Modicisalibacter radicis]|uniref:CNNM domain-containing protein n=1 Tax=Halomonas sp. EAR18 TaxID=2518972 RepID=UPI00109C4653|nr:CNNM domain-containing protein [Halomonas sp. EAR18]